MRRMRLARSSWYLFIAAATAARALAASDAGNAHFAALAQSAQVLIESAHGAQGLTLRLTRTTGGTALPVSELSATLDGKSLAVSRHADGTWQLQLPQGAAAAPGNLQLLVGHDGIRELLSASPAPGAAPAAAVTEAAPAAQHKQLWWWVLNIGIVLVAVLAISRRMS
jgi:hypothetical protein